MITNNIETPHRQAPLGVIIIFLQNLRKWLKFIVIGFFPLIKKSSSAPAWALWSVVIIAILFVVVWSYLQWKNYFFHIADEELIIKQGVLKKEESIIPLERIQSVHIKQNVVQQLLDLASLQIDTAGSNKKEVEIPALHLQFAEELKTLLIRLKESDTTSDSIEQCSTNQAENNEKLLMQFGFNDILKVGLTENHMRSAMFLFAIFFGFTNQLSEWFGFEEETVYQTVFRFVLIVLPIFIISFLFISVIVSLWVVLMKYYNLKVILKKTGLQIKSGLLKIEENFVPTQKIQFIKWQSNPLRKLIGYKSLAIYQAASQSVNKKKTVRVPGCKEQQKGQVIDAFFPEYSNKEGIYSIKPNLFWMVRLSIFIILVPFSLLFVSYQLKEIYLAIAIISYCILASFFLIKYIQRYRANIYPDLIVINRGYVFPEEVLLKMHKVQNVIIAQSIFQKRRGLVTLKIHTASGKLSIPYINQEEGYALANNLLYKVESSKLAWM